MLDRVLIEAATGGVLKNFVKFAGKRLCQSLFFNKAARLRPATLLKKVESGTGIFLWILQNFYEYLFNRTLPNNCFCSK